MSRKGVPKVTPPRNLERLRLIYATVSLCPGLKLIDLAHRLRVARGTIVSALNGMDLAGFFLYETEDGGLYPFRRIEPRKALALWREIWS
jgi:hypothetical protein